MDPITAAQAEHYRRRFLEHGATPRGIDWGSRQEDLDLRYGNMLRVIPPAQAAGPVTLLDVGCGFGGLIDYAAQHGYRLTYTGIDIVAEMVDHARTLHPDAAFHLADVFAFEPAQRFDYVVCNGALTPRYHTSIREMDVYARRFIRRLFALAEQGTAFNLMTTKVNFTEDHLYYVSPLEMLGFCMSELTTKFRIDHAYPLYEYTVYLYRSGAVGP
jgi:SAM-dependent methyltransferase